MTWLLLALVVVALVAAFRLLRRRRGLFTASRSQPLPMVRIEMSRRPSKKTKAALDAASAVLR